MMRDLPKTIHASFQNILQNIEPDAHASDLSKTPKRAEIALQKLTQGYAVDTEALCQRSLIPNTDKQSLVIIRNIFFMSQCEHHLLPFFGRCHIVYHAKDHIIGLSKATTLVEAFAHRLQLQERLTQEIATSLQHGLQAEGLGIYMQAEHCCLKLTHPSSHASTLTTMHGLGSLSEHANIIALLREPILNNQ